MTIALCWRLTGDEMGEGLALIRRFGQILVACLAATWTLHAVMAGARADDAPPAGALRPLTTDRPDLTESPFTVNAGHFQIESTLFGYARARRDEDGVREEAFEFATTNVRVGLTRNSEVALVWQPYGLVRRRPKAPATPTQFDGIGSLQLRGKVNLFGNDRFENAGDTALAILPFVTIPTDDDNGISVSDVEGGVIVPFAVVLPRNFGLGLNAGVTAVRDEDDRGYHAEVFLSAALSYAWSDDFGTYYEIAATLNTDNPDGDELILATGFTYALGANAQLDGGINFGVTDGSDRYAPFIGITQRF